MYPIPTQLVKECPNCKCKSIEIVYTNSLREFICDNCGYFEMIVGNNSRLNLEEDKGRYIYLCSYEPYGMATIHYKSGDKRGISISKRNSDSFIDNLVMNKDIINHVFLVYFKNNIFNEVDLIDFL